MTQNIDLNNVVAVATANNNVEVKEEKNMMVLGINAEELKEMKVKKLRTVAQQAGIARYSKMKKDELIAALTPMCDATKKVEIVAAYPVNPLDDPEVMAMDVSDEALMAPVVEETVTENTKVEEKKEEVDMGNFAKLMKAISKEVMFQTLPSANGKLIIKVDQDKKVILKKFSLFYRATEVDAGEYLLVVGKKLWGVVAKCIGDLYGEKNKTSENIQETLDKMAEFDLLTKATAERTYVTLTPSTMTKDEKDQLNALWSKGCIKVENLKDGRKKVTCDINGTINEEGKAVLNQLYPNWVYKATSKQLNNMLKLCK